MNNLETYWDVGVVSWQVVGVMVEPVLAQVVGDVDMVVTSLDLEQKSQEKLLKWNISDILILTYI